MARDGQGTARLHGCTGLPGLGAASAHREALVELPVGPVAAVVARSLDKPEDRTDHLLGPKGEGEGEGEGEGRRAAKGGEGRRAKGQG